MGINNNRIEQVIFRLSKQKQNSGVGNTDWETCIPGLFQVLILDKMGNALAQDAHGPRSPGIAVIQSVSSKLFKVL